MKNIQVGISSLFLVMLPLPSTEIKRTLCIPAASASSYSMYLPNNIKYNSMEKLWKPEQPA